MVQITHLVCTLYTEEFSKLDYQSFLKIIDLYPENREIIAILY
uniref:Uncharacterized protein n=1 Tax=Rhizophora mucronata TaxID=61149 RepID=A0A2P2IJW7_RHIMU